MKLYYLWHDGQVKTSNNWDDVLSHRCGYVLSTTSAPHSFAYVMKSGQAISVSPGDIPKAFVLGLLLLDIRV